MPPKRAAMAQAIRDAYNEETSCSEIEMWSAQSIDSLAKHADEARSLRGAVASANYTPASAATAPAEIVKALRGYQETLHTLYLSSDKIRTVVACRIPELKEEDNLGVGVQMAVLKMLDGLQGRLTGNGGDKEGGAPVLGGMFTVRDYLAARGGVEDKLLGKESEEGNKSSGGSKAPSVVLELQQVDADALLKMELGATQIATTLRSLINAYALNWKKLIEPRNSQSGKMVS